MILYFSGTGNSRYAAQIIAEVTGDELISMNELIKTGNKQMLESERPLVFVVPTYAWRIPRVVEKLIMEREFKGNIKAYFVMTCGSESYNAIHYVKKLCKKKGFDFRGLTPVKMPENYIAMFATPDKMTADKEIKKATPEIFAIADKIKNEYTIKGEKLTPVGALMSSIVNVVFYPLFVKAKPFYATDNCINCKKCVELCPLNNVYMVDERPKWGEDCTHCMACICGCPTNAIEYGRHSQGKPRYYNKGYKT